MNPYIIIEGARARSRDLLESAERSHVNNLMTRSSVQARRAGTPVLSGLQRFARRALATIQLNTQRTAPREPRAAIESPAA